MADKKTSIFVDGVEYQFEDMTPEQQVLINHVADLDRKLASAKFNADQLQVGELVPIPRSPSASRVIA